MDRRVTNGAFIPRLGAMLGCLLALAIQSCAGNRPAAEQVPDTPPDNRQAAVADLVPLAVAWHSELQERFSASGRTLTEGERRLAQALGVKAADAVRVVVAERFPLPQDPLLRAEAERYGLGSCRISAIAVGHLILMKPRGVDDLKLLAHELVHVAQQEAWGTEESMRRVIAQYREFGPFAAPLEVEAREKVNRLDFGFLRP